jgi:hypothetical protein
MDGALMNMNGTEVDAFARAVLGEPVVDVMGGVVVVTTRPATAEEKQMFAGFVVGDYLSFEFAPGSGCLNG